MLNIHKRKCINAYVLCMYIYTSIPDYVGTDPGITLPLGLAQRSP